MTNEIAEQVAHEKHLSAFRSSSNGNRNSNLNLYAIKSFGLALGNKHLAISKVETDYTDAGNTLGMDGNEIKNTLASALSAAQPFELSGNNNDSKPATKTNMALAPVYTALEDYAIAHHAPLSAFETAKWTEGKHEGRPCLFVPHEDGVQRVRFLDGESPKWKPIKPKDMKEKITPCWYGFAPAIIMATKATHKTIVLCNGQPSVITAHHHSIAAIAQTDGEGKLITKPLLKRLKTEISKNGLKIILAYDGDATGRKATKDIQKQLTDNDIAVRVVHFGGDKGYDLADYCGQHKAKSFEMLERLAAFTVHVEDNEHGTESLDKITESLLTDNDSAGSPGTSLPIPFRSFHSLGGYAYMTAPGKLGMIMAPSGHGKTSFMETWVDLWLQSGIDVLWYSPEWEALETHWRRIQRNGGASYDQMRLLALYRNEAAQGIAKGNRFGKQLETKTLHATVATSKKITNWPGKIFSYKAQRITEDVLEHMSKRLQLQRRNGRRVGVAVFDYMQLMRTQQEISGKNNYEVIGDMLKDWCMENHVFGLVGMQVRKDVGRNSGDKLLGMYDAQWVRPDIFNLIVTLNITEREVFDNGVGTGRMEKEPLATAHICKNSTGQTGELQLTTNFKYLSWKEN